MGSYNFVSIFYQPNDNRDIFPSVAMSNKMYVFVCVQFYILNVPFCILLQLHIICRIKTSI